MTNSATSTGSATSIPQAARQTNEAVRRHGLHPLVLLLLFACLALFGFVCASWVSGRDVQIDKAVLLVFRTPGDLSKPIGPSWGLQSAIDLSALGGFTFIWLFTAATAGFLVLVRRWLALGLFLGSIVGVSLLNALVKISFHRARPEVVPHLAEVSNSSFPSGHAMISAATYLTIGAMLAQSQPTTRARAYLMTVAVAMTLMIGISRLYLGVHWPSDVLAGWALGAAWALAVWFAARALEPVSATH
jgi:undecaprenyl-diphosphatase